MAQARILVTGATGYVGGRLVSRLLEAGYAVRALARDPNRLQGRSWYDQVEVVQGDVLDAASLAGAMQGVDAAYYLVHSLGGAGDFAARDLRAAHNFSVAAAQAGVKRILYLGGLGDPASDLSPHLRSRQQTGEVLRSTIVPVTELRAAVVVGAGSVSFEMIRYLTERLPVMICPRWVYTRIQPIAIDNVLDYLAACLETPASAGQVIEIGGADVLTYAEMMQGYAKVRGLQRILIPVPVLTPTLSAYWVHWITPIAARIAHPLIAGLYNEVVVRDGKAHRLFPQIQPLGYRQAVALALQQLNAKEVETSWSDALASSQGDETPFVLTNHEGMILERRQVSVAAPPAAVYRAFSSLGGSAGWPAFHWAWWLRGALDRLVGGVGLRRGRRHPETLRTGDALDFWRVEEVRPDACLRLRAEMKTPGRAWLQFEAKAQEDGRTLLVQTAFFAPKGLWGLLYWYALYPIHGLIFSSLIRQVKRRAEGR